MTPLRNYVLLEFLPDVEEPGLIVLPGQKSVQRARVLDFGEDVSSLVKEANIVVLRKNNTAIGVGDGRKKFFLVQETDILAVEETHCDLIDRTIGQENHALHIENDALRGELERLRAKFGEEPLLDAFDNDDGSGLIDPALHAVIDTIPQSFIPKPVDTTTSDPTLEEII